MNGRLQINRSEILTGSIDRGSGASVDCITDFDYRMSQQRRDPRAEFTLVVESPTGDQNP